MRLRGGREGGDRECYTLGGFEGQTEKPLSVCRGHSPQLLGVAIACRGELGESVGDPRWLVSFATERHRRKVRRVGLDEQTVLRNQPQQIVVAPLFERDDSAERDVPAGVDREFSQRSGAGVAVQHSRRTDRARFPDHRSGVVLGISGVNDQWLLHFRRESDLRGKRGALQVPRRVVVVVVEPAFTDGDRGVAQQVSQARDVARRIEASGVVGMNARRRENKSRIGSRDLGGEQRRRQRLTDADDPDRARPAGASDYRVAVAGERRVREVGVAVDED